MTVTMTTMTSSVIHAIKRTKNLIKETIVVVIKNMISLYLRSRRVVILGDSIVKNVNSWQLSKSLTNEKVSVKSLSGATTKQMSTYVTLTIEEKPDSVILRIGTNNLRSNNESNK